jgi:hypothetical protein
VYGYFTIRVTPPGTGRIRIAWRSAAATTYTSRVVAVTVGARRPANSTSGPEGATPLVNSTPTG